MVEPERNRLEVLTVDALVDGVHFDRRFTPATAIGHRALAANLSDLAAMGATPRMALLSFALPADLPVDDFDGIVDGIAALARTHGTTIVGGNLTRTPGPLTLDITAIGTVKRRGVLTRAGAKAGHLVYVSGSIGAAAAGLRMLQAGDAGDETCLERYLRPMPRIRIGQLLGRNHAATSCVDLSDGLGDGVARIADASAVGITIDEAALPVDEQARRWCADRNLDPVTAAIGGGDDYELLFTVHPRQRGRLRAALAHGDVPLTCIGVCTKEPGVWLKRASDGTTVPMPEGYTHFR